MAAKFVKINGLMHDPEILEIGKNAGGTITIAVAEKLWGAAADGAKVTDAEKHSVENVMASYEVQADAKAFLDKRLAARKSGCPSHLAPLEIMGGTTQYKTIMGVKYERELLNITVAATKGGKSMDLKTAEALWVAAMDGNKVTETEFRTIEFIISFYLLDQDAHDYLEGKLAGHTSIKTRKFVGESWIKPSTDKKPAAAEKPAPVKAAEPEKKPAAVVEKPPPVKPAALASKKRTADAAGLDENTCWDYIYGHCRKGERCKYIHEGELESGHDNYGYASSEATTQDVELNEEALEELGTLDVSAIDELLSDLAADGEHADVKNKNGWVIRAARRMRAEMARKEHSEWAACKAPTHKKNRKQQPKGKPGKQAPKEKHGKQHSKTGHGKLMPKPKTKAKHTNRNSNKTSDAGQWMWIPTGKKRR